MIKWKEEYKIGIEMVDQQHRRLFEIAEEGQGLLFLPRHMDKYDEIIHIIEELRDYTKIHFESEEKLMQSILYSKLFSHKVEHDDFIEKIYSINLIEMDEDQNKYLLSILEFVVTWILEHIREKDVLLAKEYKEKNR